MDEMTSTPVLHKHLPPDVYSAFIHYGLQEEAALHVFHSSVNKKWHAYRMENCSSLRRDDGLMEATA